MWGGVEEGENLIKSKTYARLTTLRTIEIVMKKFLSSKSHLKHLHYNTESLSGMEGSRDPSTIFKKKKI